MEAKSTSISNILTYDFLIISLKIFIICNPSAFSLLLKKIHINDSWKVTCTLMLIIISNLFSPEKWELWYGCSQLNSPQSKRKNKLRVILLDQKQMNPISWEISFYSIILVLAENFYWIFLPNITSYFHIKFYLTFFFFLHMLCKKFQVLLLYQQTCCFWIEYCLVNIVSLLF